MNRNDTTCGGKENCCASIQEAVNAAGDGAVIKVAQGTYSEAPSRTKAGRVAINGGWNNTFTQQSGRTDMYAPIATGEVIVNLLPNIRLIPNN